MSPKERFKSTLEPEGKRLTIKLQGHIDETTILPAVNLAAYEKILINLDGIESINSVGIRTWLKWIGPIAESKVKLSFAQVPYAFVKQFNMVSGFLPAGAKVDSVYVPSYCEKCPKSIQTLVPIPESAYANWTSFKIDQKLIQTKYCGKSPCALTPDYPEQKVFQFLKPAKK